MWEGKDRENYLETSVIQGKPGSLDLEMSVEFRLADDITKTEGMKKKKVLDQRLSPMRCWRGNDTGSVK